MCCFSGPVEDVAATRIFARMTRAGRQLIAYEMEFDAPRPVAMILPIPTVPGIEDAVRFIALDVYRSLFTDLFEAFTYPDGRPALRGKGRSAEPLPVHVVGEFVASFIPTLADFTRLDPQFRIPPDTVERVPGYGDYGFVVFQLRATNTRSRAHPMAFEFATRDAERLFFPLLHVHDGTLHTDADFDHVLYAQGLRDNRMFDHGTKRLKSLLHHPKAKLVVDLDGTLSRRELVGLHPNRDEWAMLV